MDKDFLLRVVRDLSVKELFNAIKEGVVTFEELQSTGDFTQPKQIEIRTLMARLDKERQFEQNAWNKAFNANTTEAYQAYMKSFPNGKYLKDAEFQIEEIFWNNIIQKPKPDTTDYDSYINKYPRGQHALYAKQKIESIKRIAIEERKNLEFKLTNYPESLTTDEIKSALTSNITSEEELIHRYGFTKELLALIKEPIPFTNDFNWSDLADLADNHTDVYFLGIVSSGKTCVMAGLLYYAKKIRGDLSINEHNTKGTEYANALINCIRNGSTPPPTAAAYGLNYIDLNFYSGKKDLMHPINLVEIPGETFEKTYKIASIKEIGSVGANNYLKNENDKIVYLVIDYNQETSATKIQSRKDQGAHLSRILNLMKGDGTLEKTRAVYLLLTKCDKLPNGANDYVSAEAFINREFKDLSKNLYRLSKQYKFETRLINFSLGKFSISEFFIYNPESSKVIYDSIVNLAFTMKENHK